MHPLKENSKLNSVYNKFCDRIIFIIAVAVRSTASDNGNYARRAIVTKLYQKSL